MGIILGILEFVVVVAVVMSVSRAVWNGQSQSSRSVLLSALIGLVMLVFGLVSFTAAYGLAENSSFNQGALLIFLVATGVAARISWADKSVIQP
jgi:predicted neutral ceramidase superfamily lipid hydrolase